MARLASLDVATQAQENRNDFSIRLIWAVKKRMDLVISLKWELMPCMSKVGMFIEISLTLNFKLIQKNTPYDKFAKPDKFWNNLKLCEHSIALQYVILEYQSQL